MKLLAHRGTWNDVSDKNSDTALQRSFASGIGVETDFRDLNGTLVISHDPPEGSSTTVKSFLQWHYETDPSLPIAINVKADGLQTKLTALVDESIWENSFVFDMSVPDTVQWLKSGVPVYVRHSEYEPNPVLLDHPGVKGIWLDAWESQWWSASDVERHIEAGRRVAIVSPELHGRGHEEMWQSIADSNLHESESILLCTDLPAAAIDFFNH